MNTEVLEREKRKVSLAFTISPIINAINTKVKCRTCYPHGADYIFEPFIGESYTELFLKT